MFWLFLILLSFSWIPGTSCQANTSTETSFVAPTTSLISSTTSINELWLKNPGQSAPVDGVSIYLCTVPMSTTSMPTTSYTSTPSKVTSETVKSSFGTKQTGSTLSIGSTGSSELPENNQTSNTAVRSTSMQGSSTWYGTSTPFVSSTTSGSSGTTANSTTMFSSKSASTSTSERGTQGTGSTVTTTGTKLVTSSVHSTVSETGSTATTLSQKSLSYFFTTGMSSTKNGTSSIRNGTSSTAISSSSSTVLSTSTITVHKATNSTISGSTASPMGSTSLGTSISSDNMPTTISTTDSLSKSTSSGMSTSSDTDGTDGTERTNGTIGNNTTPQTKSNLFESNTTTPISSSSLFSPITSNFSDSTSGPITSTSDSEVSSSMSSQETTEAELDEISSTISTKSITIHETAETSVSTQKFIEAYTEAPRSSSTEFFYSTSSEDSETTDSYQMFSNPSTEFSDGTSESTNSIGTGSTSLESQSSVTSTKNAETSSETTIFFRSESTAKTTTSSPSTLSTISDNVELPSESASTTESPSEPTSSTFKTGQGGDETTTTEQKSSKEISSEPIASEPPASTSTEISSGSFSTSTQLELPSSMQTTTDYFESTMAETESSQEAVSTTLGSKSEAPTYTEEETTATASTSTTGTISQSSSKSTTGKVETTSVITTSTDSAATSVEPSEKPTPKSSKSPTTSHSSSASSSTTNAASTAPKSSPSSVSTLSATLFLKTSSVTVKSTTTGTFTTSQSVTSTIPKTSDPTFPKATTKGNIATSPLPTQSRKSSPTSSTSEQTTSSGSPPSFTVATSNQSTPSTTENLLCKQQCPPGYLIGTSMCFKLIPPSSKVNSYQSALSFCKATDRQTLASLDKIRDDSDIKMIQESARLQNIDWLYANGIGSKQERFQKLAWVYSIFSQSLVSSPILMSVGISEFFGNISALCVLPQYCISIDCDVEKLFLAYEYYNSFEQSAGTLFPDQQGDVTCLYGNQKTTKVTCNALGAIYPNPTNINCEESASERKIIDTTNKTVESCQICFGKGTKECQAVVGSNGNVKGYRCVCEEPFAMASCWRTGNPCNTSFCGTHGKCVSVLGDVSCSCDWGYTGENCEFELAEKYKGDFGYSSAVGATMTLGTIVFRVLKIALMGFTLSNEQEDDPQETHQKLRSYLMTGAGVILCFYSNPTLLAITPAACRFYYVAIHFCYIMAMVQWLFEGWNVNQVLRCVHLNEWEVDWKGNRLWGVKIVPRMIGSFSLLGVFLLITFRTGWNKLAASWTCVGVICQETLNIWIPLFVVVFIIVFFGATIYESSTLIKYRRPLLGYKIDMKIERELGREIGRRVQKCRENDLLSLIGLLLLVAQYISIIYCSDKRDEPFYGITAIVVALIYTAFYAYQEIITCPEDCARLLQLIQRWFPIRFAPDYNPETMWTLPEVREHYSFSNAEREERYQAFLSRNEKLFIHHRWDLRINEIFAENEEKFKINAALVQIWIEEMNDLKAKNGTVAQKFVIQEVYADYMDTIPYKDPRDAGKLNGRLELVTLAAEDDEHGVKLAKFFIVPTFHTFNPEMPDSSHTPQNEIIRNNERKLMAELEKDIYKLTREVSEKQKTFASSAIIFWNYGNKVVR